jgi:hypothetical protein
MPVGSFDQGTVVALATISPGIVWVQTFTPW